MWTLAFRPRADPRHVLVPPPGSVVSPPPTPAVQSIFPLVFSSVGMGPAVTSFPELGEGGPGSRRNLAAGTARARVHRGRSPTESEPGLDAAPQDHRCR